MNPTTLSLLKIVRYKRSQSLSTITKIFVNFARHVLKNLVSMLCKLKHCNEQLKGNKNTDSNQNTIYPSLHTFILAKWLTTTLFMGINNVPEKHQ